MKQKTIGLLATAGIWVSAVTCQVQAAVTFLKSDVSQWYGVASGAGVSEAVLVIQWPGEINAFAWGYRWDSSQTKTGADMLAELAALSNGQFVVEGLEGGFVTDLQWQGRSFPGYNPSTGEYLQYFVNNEQQSGNFNDGAAPGGAHILPPLGSPFDGTVPSNWRASNTGVFGRPLVDGSWDGWSYSAFGAAGPASAVNAPGPIPEPTTVTFAMAALLTTLVRRRR